MPAVPQSMLDAEKVAQVIPEQPSNVVTNQVPPVASPPVVQTRRPLNPEAQKLFNKGDSRWEYLKNFTKSLFTPDADVRHDMKAGPWNVLVSADQAFADQGYNLKRLAQMAFTKRPWDEINREYDASRQRVRDWAEDMKIPYNDESLNSGLQQFIENTGGNAIAAIPAAAAGGAITKGLGAAAGAVGKAVPAAGRAAKAVQNAYNTSRAVRYPAKWLGMGAKYSGLTPGNVAVAPALIPTVRSQLTDNGKAITGPSTFRGQRGVMNVTPFMNFPVRGAMYLDDYLRGMTPGSSDYGQIPLAETPGTVTAMEETPQGTRITVAPDFETSASGYKAPYEYTVPKGYTLNVKPGDRFQSGDTLGYSPVGNDRYNETALGNILKSFNSSPMIDMYDQYLDTANSPSESVRKLKYVLPAISQISTAANPLLRNVPYLRRFTEAMPPGSLVSGGGAAGKAVDWLGRHTMASAPELFENFVYSGASEGTRIAGEAAKQYDDTKVRQLLESWGKKPREADRLSVEAQEALKKSPGTLNHMYGVKNKHLPGMIPDDPYGSTAIDWLIRNGKIRRPQ